MQQILWFNMRYGSRLCENAPAEALTAVDLGEVGALSHFREFEEFWPEVTPDADSDCLVHFCNSRRPHGGDDYARIAARSG